jgi:predicted negative regulator of RcsB-dependent stress response
MADDKMQEKETPQPQAVPGEEMAQIREVWESYGRSVTTGVLLALVLVLGITVYRQYQQNKQDQAAAALGNAVATEDFEQFLVRYPRAPSAPIAMLALARAQFESGAFEDALATYARFKQAHPEHPMRQAAEVGHAQALEAAGRLAEAESVFRALAGALPEDHYLQPAAQLGIGRTLEQLGRWEEARAVYEDFIAAHPENDWADQAEVALRFVRRSLAAQREAAAATP